jgi:hypothetical protein
MAFTVTATPDSFALEAGQSQDVVFTFDGVAGDESAQGTEMFALGGEQFVADITLTRVAPGPQSVGFTLPAGVDRTLVSIDDTQAVVRYSRV